MPAPRPDGEDENAVSYSDLLGDAALMSASGAATDSRSFDRPQ